ncbi:1,2-dihydroxy-3-keto-5-methylthiopentene dioxygenase [Aureobasidium pullulans]|uniref:Acireductone dioxygenase n=1 Tax=Aureobasidium pullulans TaxID=5580 RepID=A0A4S9LVR5_AURPU|nr:1,2-dihydroxy-3-keto-5-methylthiopentene dioxygenase [Aureobasidium pullulans]
MTPAAIAPTTHHYPYIPPTKHSSNHEGILGDQRLPHDSGRPVTPSDLSKLGIICHNFPSLDDVNELASSRNYKNRDEVTISPTTLPNYEEKVKVFFHEHLHEDEEIRYILDGAGYFDVRSEGDDWIRLRLEKGDLAIMPAGIYHRFTVDDKNVSTLQKENAEVEDEWDSNADEETIQYTKAMRLFKDEPKWTPLQRGAETDENNFRKEYLKSREEGTILSA